MKNYLRSTVAALGYGLLTAGVLAPTVAITQPLSAPRQFNTQQVHYIRISLSPTMCASTGANLCKFKAPNALPYNSIILRVTAAIGTGFNSVATDAIFLGTTLANANEILGAGCAIHTAGLIPCTIASGGAAGINQVGAGATQTGTNGGFDLFVAWNATGGGPATTGSGALIIEYVAPNDGSCSATPMGATAAGC